MKRPLKEYAAVRALEKCEEYIACPTCKAPKGSPCFSVFADGPDTKQIAFVAHVERKRAAGREWRITTIVGVLNKHGIETKHNSETSGAIEIATAIHEALNARNQERSK